MKIDDIWKTAIVVFFRLCCALPQCLHNAQLIIRRKKSPSPSQCNAFYLIYTYLVFVLCRMLLVLVSSFLCFFFIYTILSLCNALFTPMQLYKFSEKNAVAVIYFRCFLLLKNCALLYVYCIV